MVGRPSPLTIGAGAGGALGLRPASVYQIPSQPVLHSVILSSKQTERKMGRLLGFGRREFIGPSKLYCLVLTVLPTSARVTLARSACTAMIRPMMALARWWL